MSNPLVSVLCPTFNHGKFIAQAMEGFLSQITTFDFEIIIHDDASSDDTVKLIKNYIAANKNKRISFNTVFETENQYSQGITDYLKNMFMSAKGKYIAFCEGDDYWIDAQKLQKQVDFLEKHPDYAVCFHPVKVFYENHEKPDSVYPETTDSKAFTIKQLLKENFIQTNSVMYRKQNYATLIDTVMPMDWYLHLFHAQFGKIGFIPDAMSAYRRHVGGLWWEAQKGTAAFWKRQGLVHIGLFVELEKIYGTNAQYKKVLHDNLHHIMYTILNLDKSHSGELVEAVIRSYPAQAKDFLVYQSGEFKKTIEDRDAIFVDRNYRETLANEREAELAVMSEKARVYEQELLRIKSSPGYKVVQVVNRLKRLAKR